MNVLITGAAGFIGYFLSRRLLENGHSVTGIDEINDYYAPRLKTARLALLGINNADPAYGVTEKSSTFPGFRFVKMHLEDREGLMKLFAEGSFDVAVNLAGQAACAILWKIPSPTCRATFSASSICWNAAAPIR